METREIPRKWYRRHALIMALCCLIPVVAIAVLWAMGVPNNYLFLGVMLLCPLLHIVMMRGGGHNH